jgi:hypothetical protein
LTNSKKKSLLLLQIEKLIIAHLYSTGKTLPFNLVFFPCQNFGG